MKNGMIFLAALMAVAIVFTPAAYSAQDTKTINSAIASTAGPGPDITVGSDGSIYASFGEGNNVQVYKGSAGSAITTQRGVAAAADTVRLTAIGLTTGSVTGKDTPVVAAFVGQANTSPGTDTSVILFYSTTSANLAASIRVHPIHNNQSLGAAGETFTVTGLDLAVNDSYIVVITSISSTMTTDSNSVTRLHAYRYDNSANAPTLTHTLILDSGSCDNLQVIFDPVEKNSTGTNVIWVARTQTVSSLPAGAAFDSGGVTVQKVYLTVAGLFVQVDTLMRTVGDSRSIGRIVAEDVSGSDTRARISVAVSSLDTTGSGKIRIIEFGDSRTASLQPTFANTGRKAAGIGAADSYTVSFDTGASNYGQTHIRSMTFGRSSDNVGFNLLLATNSSGDIPTNSTDTVIAFTQSIGSSSFSSDTAITSSRATGRLVRNLSGAMISGTLYTVGYDGGPTLLWYTRLLGGDSGKKSNGGVCLLDRMFGQTSLRAIFPGLKMFRDTLLGTDMGRKIVSLYYTF